MPSSHFYNSLFSLMALVFWTIPALAQGTAPASAATCVACHGPEGRSVNDLWPSLAGQKSQYLIKQLHSFRDGTRVDPLMSPVSKILSDEDIKELATYFSNIKLDIKSEP